MSNKSIVTLAIIALVFGILVFLIPIVLSSSTVVTLTKEDSPVEYFGALFFFSASVLFLLTFFNSRSGNNFWRIETKKNFIFLGLALILFFGAGEEISWGQRILGYGTPTPLEANKQDEVTLHNLPAFDPTNESSLVNMNRMFSYFWFSFGILIPGLALLYRPLREWLQKLGFPLVPLLIGVQFLLFYILSKFYGPLDFDKDVYNGRLVELRETIHAFIFAIIALYFYLNSKDLQSTDSHRFNPKADDNRL